MLPAPVAAFRWLLALAGAGPDALVHAETGISWLALHHVQLHIEFARNLCAVLYFLVAAAVFALAAVGHRARRIGSLAAPVAP